MNDIFDVLADPIRREILGRLHKAAPGDLAVGDVVSALGLTQPTVSKHLKVLREAGLVTVREDGQHRYYRLQPEPLAVVDGWVSALNGAKNTPRPTSKPVKDSPPVATSYLSEIDFSDAGRRVGRAAARAELEVRSVIDALRTILGSNPR
jgi:DNA-binding transcriptional ArsR family regulator